MDCDTGRLMRLSEGQDPPEGFIQVPDEFIEEVKKELGDKDSVMVDMTKDTPLVNWANQHRKGKKKALRKMARKSRRENRK